MRASFFILFAAAVLTAQMRDVIIDTDPGVDDALAILAALHSPELKIHGITVVAGNVKLPVGLNNALRLVAACNRPDVPVAAGAVQPLLRKLVTAENVHGADGLGGAAIAATALKPSAETAVTLIRRVVHANPGQVTIIALGPLTNIAQALHDDATLAPQIKQIVLMGGAFHGGNMTPVAEFNIYVDPDAARQVFLSGVPILMSGWDASQDIVLTPDHAARLTPGSPAALIANGALARAKARNRPGMTMYDPIALIAFLDPSSITTQTMFVDVETQGELTAGQTIGYTRAPVRGSVPLRNASGSEIRSDKFTPNADVITRVNSGRFFEQLLARLNR